jgi:hypothetical protein
MGRSSLVIAVAVLACVSASPASASKWCRGVHVTDKRGTTIEATVRVKRGPAKCRTARRVGRRILSERAPYHQGQSTTDSYYIVGPWHGSQHTGTWGATNQRNGAWVGGRITYWKPAS